MHAGLLENCLVSDCPYVLLVTLNKVICSVFIDQHKNHAMGGDEREIAEIFNRIYEGIDYITTST